jgi:hypothetical protein
MFSYSAGILQTHAAKRAENHFNGVRASSSGKSSQPMWRQPPFCFA